MDEKMREIEGKWEEEFKSDWDKLKQKAEQFCSRDLDVVTIEALCKIYYFQACRERQKRIKELEDARLLEAQRGDHWIEKYKELEAYHRPDCNCLLDDESDAVLYDYQSCTCPSWQKEVIELKIKIKELEEELDKIRRTQDYFINKPQTD